MIHTHSHGHNRLFDPDERDDCNASIIFLREKLLSSGYRLETSDDHSLENCAWVWFFSVREAFPYRGMHGAAKRVKDYLSGNRPFRDLYTECLRAGMSQRLALFLWEAPAVSSLNWNPELHDFFRIIFTWNDKFVDNKKYFKINYAHKIPIDLDFDLSKKNKLFTMIAGHKFTLHPLELYTERLKAIRWFEQNHPEEFDLYGTNWDKYRFRGILSGLNRFECLTRPLKSKYPSCKGPVKSKREILQKYRFAICYENIRDIPGYITEKIFDCFFAGCVPVYWGASNVGEHIPADTFIDRRNFKCYEELYSYLKNMPYVEYACYLEAIKNFIKSDKIYPFSAECFAETVINQIEG